MGYRPFILIFALILILARTTSLAFNLFPRYKSTLLFLLKNKLQKYYRNLSDDEKVKKREVMLALEIKIYQTRIEKGKNGYMKNY